MVSLVTALLCWEGLQDLVILAMQRSILNFFLSVMKQALLLFSVGPQLTPLVVTLNALLHSLMINAVVVEFKRDENGCKPTTGREFY